jgi:D-beta-D-heptose 7-phosphate kinase/D-beta-D-heptose 1-phosphate adenosyltransferase
LSAEALLVGVVGADAEARLLNDELERAMVGSEHLIAVVHRPTTVKTRVIAHSQQVARVDQETDAGLDPSTHEKVIGKLTELVPKCDAIIVSDYAKGLLTDELLVELADIAKRAGKSVFVDPKGKDYRKYRGVTMITPNRREAAEACNFSESTDGMTDKAGAKLLEDLGLDAVLITQGEEGMTLFRPTREPQHFPTAAREVYDVTGAGDTVIATLATAIGAGADMETATSLANIAAGLVVEQVGTSAVTHDELRRAIETS